MPLLSKVPGGQEAFAMFLRTVLTVIILSVTQAEDRATLRSDLSAALGPKSKRDGWKHFSSRWRFETPFLANLFEFGVRR